MYINTSILYVYRAVGIHGGAIFLSKAYIYNSATTPATPFSILFALFSFLAFSFHSDVHVIHQKACAVYISHVLIPLVARWKRESLGLIFGYF